MTYIDLHTHHAVTDDVLAIRQGIESWGIHPAQAGTISWPDTLPDSVVMIGECGLDRLCGTPDTLQKDVFHQQIMLSEAQRMPLIVHCVKAVDDILLMRNRSRAVMPWIIHGFRGKPQQARSFLSRGYYLSFGFHFQTETLKCCPLKQLFLETDTDPRPIKELYRNVAEILQMDVTGLSRQIEQNFRSLHTGLYFP